jgi:hypothetical protein
VKQIFGSFLAGLVIVCGIYSLGSFPARSQVSLQECDLLDRIELTLAEKYKESHVMEFWNKNRPDQGKLHLVDIQKDEEASNGPRN